MLVRTGDIVTASKLDEALVAAAKTNATLDTFGALGAASKRVLAGPNNAVLGAYLAQVRHADVTRTWPLSKRGKVAKSTYSALVQTWTLAPPAAVDLFTRLTRIAQAAK